MKKIDKLDPINIKNLYLQMPVSRGRKDSPGLGENTCTAHTGRALVPRVHRDTHNSTVRAINQSGSKMGERQAEIVH